MSPRYQHLHDLQNTKAMEDGSKKAKWGFVQFFFLLSLILCMLLYAPRFFISSSYRLELFTTKITTTTTRGAPLLPQQIPKPSPQQNISNGNTPLDNQLHSPCSSLPNHTICCDRANFHTDVCFMAGDVRTHAASLSLLLFPPPSFEQPNTTLEERIRPYTRKWERFMMDMIQEIRLRVARQEEAADHPCDVWHDAPAVLMTAGGYTGNLYHAFNDGFLPLWTTVQHLHRHVVLAVLSYNGWWSGVYHEIISGLSDYEPVDFLNDKRTHCFPGAIVGTRFHGILEVDPTRLRDNKTILDFRQLLADVYEPKSKHKQQQQHVVEPSGRRRPKLVIMSRKGTRVIENQVAVAQLATEIGFDVEILQTASGIPLAEIYATLSTCHAMIGVHGADLTKFLFMRPGAAFVQIVPLGIDRVAHECFGEPSVRMGLRYVEYKVRPNESSLSRRYGMDDLVVTDPEKAKVNRGWEFVKEVYLAGQNVTLDLGRFREVLAILHTHAVLEEQASLS